MTYHDPYENGDGALTIQQAASQLSRTLGQPILTSGIRTAMEALGWAKWCTGPRPGLVVLGYAVENGFMLNRAPGISVDEQTYSVREWDDYPRITGKGMLCLQGYFLAVASTNPFSGKS